MTKTTQYKNTAIGLIPTDWDVKKLGNIITYKKGFAFKNEYYTESGRRIIRVSDTNADGIKKDGKIFISEDLAKSYKDYELHKNDIVIQTVGSRPPMYDSMVGKAIKVDSEFEGTLLNQNAVLIRSKNNDFLFKNLKIQRYINYISSLIRGNANQVSITLSDIFKYEIPLPPLLEQQKIAEVLTTWDKAIQNTEAIIKKLEERNKGVATSLLTGESRIKVFKNSPSSVLEIKDVAKEISLKNKEDRNYTVFSCTKYNGLVPSLEYFGKKIYSDNLKTYKIIKRNQFAYATNHIEEGSMGILEKEEVGLISPMYTIFEFTENVNLDYIFKMLKSDFYINEYKRRMEGSIDRRGGLRWSAFAQIKINLPTLEEQNAIAEILNTANQEVIQYQQKLETLKLQKKGLMQQLLTGKVRTV